MPKILAYIHAYLPYHYAGGETTIHDLLVHLVKNGWEATVMVAPSLNNFPEYDLDGVHVIHAVDRRDITNVIHSYDVVMSHLGCSQRVALLARRFKKPMVHLIHNDMPGSNVAVASGCDLAVFNTEWIANSYPDYKGLRCVVRPPVDPDHYLTSSTREFITLVNLWPDKGSKVFYHLAEKFPDQKFLGVIGGYGHQDVRDLPNVTIMDHSRNIKDDVYARTKLILMPSVYESFGRVAVEAACSGIPSIVSPTPGLREALGETGTYVHQDDLEGWEAALTKILKPRAYSAASKKASGRSKELAEARIEELDYFLALSNQLAKLRR